MTFDIRPAQASQSGQILQQHISTCATHAERFPAMFKGETHRQQMEQLLSKCFPGTDPTAEAKNIFVAMRGDQMLGYIVLTVSHDANYQIEDLMGLTIYDIWVNPADRKTGIGRALVNHATDTFRTHGYAEFGATVWRGNPASAAMLAACGFTEIYRSLKKIQDPEGALRREPPPPKPRSFSLTAILIPWVLLFIALLAHLAR